MTSGHLCRAFFYLKAVALFMNPESIPRDAQSLAKEKEVTGIMRLCHVSKICISIEKELGLRELLEDESLLLYLNSWSDCKLLRG